MSQTSQIVFLETSIQVQRVLGSTERRSQFAAVLGTPSIHWVSSAYVWMEYQRAVVADFAYIHRIMGRYADWGSLFEHVLDGARAFRPRSAVRCTQIVAKIYRASGEIYPVARDILDNQISRDLRRAFGKNVTPIEDTIVCDLVRIGVARQSDENYTVADSCKQETAACHLPDFLRQHQTELRTIHDYLAAHPNALKDQPRLERVLTAIIADPRAALGQSSCWPFGDVIIALQVPENASLWTLDADFTPLLTVLGRQLFTPQLTET